MVACSILVCQNCKREFTPKKLSTNRKFCSRSCSTSANNRIAPRRTFQPRTKECAACNEPFTTTPMTARSRRCSTCVENETFPKQIVRQGVPTRELTLGDYVEYHRSRNHHKSLQFCEVRAYCRLWNKHLERRCQVCGYTLHVDLCHIKPLSELPLTTTVGQANDESNIVVLCKNHHWELDHGFLAIEAIPSRWQAGRDSNPNLAELEAAVLPVKLPT